MSPAQAVSDSDLRAVELLFEGLMKLSPDGVGGCRWEPELAEGRPRLTPHGREFQLPESACWSDGQPLRAIDFRSTVELLKKGQTPRRPRVWADLLEDVNVVDPTRVNLTLRQGWLDPLALMNFKVLPPGSETDSVAFAEHPLGSGPFVYGGTAIKDGRTCAYFTANPFYGARARRAGLPHLQEIRFFTYKDDPVKELSGGRLRSGPRPDGEGGGRHSGAGWRPQHAKPAAQPPPRIDASISWRSTIASRPWRTRPSAAPWPTPSTATSCWTIVSGRSVARLAHAAQRSYPAASWASNSRTGP